MSDDGSRSVSLSKPITAYGEQVSQVALRRPTVLDLAECGQPYVVVATGGGALKADCAVCRQLLTRVCTPPLPLMAVDALDPADFDDMCMILVGFTKAARRGAAEAGSPQSN